MLPGDTPQDEGNRASDNIALDERGDQRLSRLEQLHGGYHTVSTELKHSQPELAKLQTELAQAIKFQENLNTRFRENQVAVVGFQNELNALRRQDPRVRAPLLEQELQNRFQMSGQLRREIAKTQQHVNVLAERISISQQKVAEIAGLPAQMLEEFFWLCDPFGKLGSAVHQRAIGHLDQWIAEDARSSLPHLASGFSHMHVGQHKLALDYFERAGQLDQRVVALACAARGLAFSKKGDPRSARKEFAKAKQLKLRPEVFALFQAYASIERGRNSEAERHFRTAIRGDRSLPHAYQALAYLLATSPGSDVRKGKQAMELATTACELTDWDDWRYLDTLAITCAAAGEFEKAIEWSKKCLQSVPRENEPQVAQRLRLYEAGRPYRVE